MSWDESQQPVELPRVPSGVQDGTALPSAPPPTGFEQSEHPQTQLPNPPAKKNTGRFMGLAIGVVVATGAIGAYAVLAGSNSPASSASALASTGATTTGTAGPLAGDTTGASASTALSLSSDADGLVLLSSADAKQEVANVRSGVGVGGAVYAGAQYGAYGPTADGGYRLVLVDQALSNIPAGDRSQFAAYTPSEFVQAIVSVIHMPGAQVETSTNPAAALTCGTITADGESVPTCIWEDSESFGLAYFYSTYYTTSLSAAAQYTDALRAAAEGS